MAKKKEIQYAVMENAEDGAEPYFCFYDSIKEAVEGQTGSEASGVEVWKFEGEILGTYKLESVVKKVKR